MTIAFGLIHATHICKNYGKRTYLPQPTRLVRKLCKFTTSPELGSATTNTHQAQGKYLQHVVHCSCNHKPPPPSQCCPRIPFGTPNPLFPSPSPPNLGAIMRSHSQTDESGSTLHRRPPRHRSSAYTWCIANESPLVLHRHRHSSTQGRNTHHESTAGTCHTQPKFLFLLC